MASDSEQSAKSLIETDKKNAQSFTLDVLKDLSSTQPEDFDLSEDALGQISVGPRGPGWFKLEQEGPKKASGMGGITR